MAAKNEERAHALLGASSAKKWLNCTPSAKLEETMEDTTSDSAEEGTLAHSVCELKLSRLFTDTNMTQRTFTGKFNKLKKEKHYNAEMDGFTDKYVEYISQIAYGYQTAPYVAIEKRVDYGNYAKDGFGTSDCIILSGEECHVIDFKYGKGVAVSAEGNPQMGLYALGVLNAYGIIYPIKRVTMHIVQPRLSNYSSWQTSRDELVAWGNAVVKPKAELAYAGAGEYKQGDWCDSGFCKAAGTCRKRAEENMAVGETNPIDGKLKLPPLLNNKEVGDILEQAQFLAAWVKKLEAFALKEMENGNKVDGWKLVEGRSNRVIAELDTVLKKLMDAGYDKAILYNTEPLAMTRLESVIDGEDWKSIVSPSIIKPPGKPTMALETDPREEYKLKPTAEEAFGGENSFHKEEQI